MKKKRIPAKISYQEMQELWNAGLVIKSHYDGAFDGWSYSLHLIGNWDKSLAWHTTARACYNAAKKQGRLTTAYTQQGAQADTLPRCEISSECYFGQDGCCLRGGECR